MKMIYTLNITIKAWELPDGNSVELENIVSYIYNKFLVLYVDIVPYIRHTYILYLSLRFPLSFLWEISIPIYYHISSYVFPNLFVRLSKYPILHFSAKSISIFIHIHIY